MAKQRRPRRPRHRFHKRAAPGATPGTLITDPQAPKPVLRLIQYGAEDFREQKLTDLDRLPSLLGKYPVTWLNVDGLGDAAAIEKLGQVFGLHPLALEDVVNVHQRPKLEEYSDHVFVVARMIALTDRLHTEQISIFFGDNFVLTFQESPGDCLEPVRERLRKTRGRTRRSGADYLVYALLDAVVDAYFPVIETYADRLDQLDDEVSTPSTPDVVARIHAVSRELALLRKTSWQTRDVVNALIREENPIVAEETRVFLRDCYDHTLQVADAADFYREICSDLRDSFFSQVTNRTNDIMKLLTIIASIFIPLSFIAGVYGMNFNPEKSPWNMPELNWVYGYPFALGLMGCIASGLIAYIWRKGWLRD